MNIPDKDSLTPYRKYILSEEEVLRQREENFKSRPNCDSCGKPFKNSAEMFWVEWFDAPDNSRFICPKCLVNPSHPLGRMDRTRHEDDLVRLGYGSNIFQLADMNDRFERTFK